MASNPPPNPPNRGNRVPTNTSALAANQALAPGAARTQMQPAQNGQTAAQPQFAFQPQISVQGQAQGQQQNQGQQQSHGQFQFQSQPQASQFQTQGQPQVSFQTQAFGQPRLQGQQQQGFGQQQRQASFQFGQPQFQAQQQAPFQFQPQAQPGLGQAQSQGQQQNPFQFQPSVQTQQRQAQLQNQVQGQAGFGQAQLQGQQQNPFQFRPQAQTQNQVQLSQQQNHTHNQQANGQPHQSHGQAQGLSQQRQAQFQNQGQRQVTAQQQNFGQQQSHGQLQGLGQPQAGLGQNQSQGLQQNPFLFQPQGQAQQRQAQPQNQSQLNGAIQQQNHAQHQQANGQSQQNLGQQQLQRQLLQRQLLQRQLLQRQLQQRQAQSQNLGQLQGATQQQNIGQQQNFQGFSQPQAGFGQVQNQGLQQNPFQFQPQSQILQHQGQLQGAAAQQQGLGQPQFQAQQQNPGQQFGQQQAPHIQMIGQQQALLQFQGQGQPQLPPPAGFFIPNAPFQFGAPAPTPIPLWVQPPQQQQQQVPLQGYGQPGEEPVGVRQFNQGVTERQGRTQDELDALGIDGTEFVENLDDADIEAGDEAAQDDQGQEDAEESEDEDMQDEEMQDAGSRDAGTQAGNMPNGQQQQQQQQVRVARTIRTIPHVEDPHMYDAVIYEDAWDSESDREPDVEVETRKINGATKQRYKFTEAFLKEHFNGKDPYEKEKKEIVAIPLMKSGMDLITTLCKNLELAIELGKHLRGEDILNLYIACRGFREALDGHMLSSIREWIRSRAPEAGRLFPWRSVAKFLVPDPAKRSSSGTDKTPGGVRLIPGMKYLQMILGRDRYCRQILAVMARMGLRVPDTMHTTLLRIWHLLEVATCAQRSQLMSDTSLWTDQHLYNAQFFFVKLTMAFNHPFFRPHSHEMLHLMMGQRGLYPLWQCLTRKKFRTMSEIVEAKARYDMHLPPPAWFNPNRSLITNFHGVPFRELGVGHCEGWGAGTRHLLRPDELVVTESINRSLDLDKHLNHMLVWGYIDFKTGENLVPTEEEMYLSDEEEVLEDVDTTCWWQKRHALKKRWTELTPEQRQDIEEDEEDERLRAMAWCAQYDPDDKNDRHASKWDSESEDESDQEYDPNVEINRGYRMQALPKDQPSQVPALDDKEAWSDLCSEFLMTTQVEVNDDQVAKANEWLKFSKANMVTPFDQDRYDMGDPFMRSRVDWVPPRPPIRPPRPDDDDEDDDDDEMEDDEEEGEEGEGEGEDEDGYDEDDEDDEEDYEDYYDEDDEMQE